MMSTPEPSSNNSPTDEWGTGVPTGAFFKSNQKSSIKNDEEGDAEDNEAGVNDEAGGDDDEQDEQEGSSDADSSDNSIVQ
jgi:hypothetical protein